MRAPRVTPSPQKQKEGHKKTHCSTPMGRYDHNDSHTAKSTTNTIEINKTKEKENKGRGFCNSVPYDGRKDHRGQ